MKAIQKIRVPKKGVENVSNDESDLDTPGGIHGVSQPLIPVERIREKRYEKSNQRWKLFHGVNCKS